MAKEITTTTVEKPDPPKPVKQQIIWAFIVID